MLQKRCVFGVLLLGFLSSLAYASGDFSCAAPRGSVFFRGYDACNSVPFLSPGNDSQLNLELLLLDAGKLTVAPIKQADNTVPPDWAALRVPFDLGDFHLEEPGKRGGAGSGDAGAAADSSTYAEGEGSRCNSAGKGLEAFSLAVKSAAGLPAEEGSLLIASRANLLVGCSSDKASGFQVPQGVRSALGREFAAYILGANAFYGGDFQAALKDFKSLRNSANPWLKETSRYMEGRTLLNSAQEGAFGDWGNLDLSKVNKEDVKGAEEAFNGYLHDFPVGIYAASARGLLRRVYWLGGDQEKMAEAFDSAFAASGKGANNVTVLDLIQEADAKLLAGADVDRIKSPQILAIADLMEMRSSGMTLEKLEAQKPRFASNPRLHEYLLALFHVYVDNKPKLALTLLPGLPKAPLSYFAFSQQTVRALALEAGKDFDEERKQIKAMLHLSKLPLQNEQLQLMLARLEERTGHLDRVFAPDSPIHDGAIRTILVEHSVSAEMLRQRITDGKEDAGVVDAALYTLLYKELTGGKYAAFKADLALVPTRPSEFVEPFVQAGENKDLGYRCPALRDVASALERDGNDAKGLNCVGELVRLHGVHYGQETVLPETDLGRSASPFPLTKYSRMDGYLKVIANEHAEGDARAYALARAVRCYEPSGNNQCGEQNIPPATRKQWFQTLHKQYADSVWAKQLRYYW